MRKRTSRFLVLAALGAFAPACSSGDAGQTESAAEAPSAAVPSLAAATGVGLRNAREPVDRLVTGGQPSAEQVDALVGAGFSHFISLRPAAEDGAGWEEAGIGSPATFARIPISGGSDLTRENVEALDRLLAEGGDDGTVLYCASGNRVGALLALRAAWLQDMTAEEALELGRAAGMTRLEPVVAQLLGITP